MGGKLPGEAAGRHVSEELDARLVGVKAGGLLLWELRSPCT